MCEPVTIAALGTAAAAGASGATVAGLSGAALAALAGSAVAAAGSAYQQSAAARAQAKFQSGMARNNQTMAEYAAADAVERGGEAAARASAEARRLRGAQTTRMAAAGLDLTSGSPLSILEDTDFFSQQDAQTIRNNAARQAWGQRVEGSNFGASADMYRRAAKAESPIRSASVSLLGSASQFYTARTAGQRIT